VNPCLICLREVSGGGDYHPRCARTLFGTTRPPVAEDLDLAKLHTLALAMAGRTSLSGVQRKIAVNLSADRRTLQVAQGPGAYILKPQSSAYPQLPENEVLTMRIAEAFGVEIPACGLVRLADGSLAYLVRRFDRPAGGSKLLQEDFCQLAAKRAKEKYDGSAELCARLVRRYATEPVIELLKLLRVFVVTWVTGNGNMHLKNLSLLAAADRLYRLSPAYDCLCTRLVIPGDTLALPIVGKREHLVAADWNRFGDYCGLPLRATDRLLRGIVAADRAAAALISRSLLSEESKREYTALVAGRVSDLL
jgi:serine/threonine-protein kinase HipA